ncbi:hypothetical protein ACHAWX_000980, partial [Stephanocyclus meneghinianus]
TLHWCNLGRGARGKKTFGPRWGWLGYSSGGDGGSSLLSLKVKFRADSYCRAINYK